jgi:gamma-glutamyltranspeptidase/glutathione hydrolase
MLALELSKDLGGKLPLDVLLSSAIQDARGGYRVTRSQSALTRDKFVELRDVPGFSDVFLVDDLAPVVGTLLTQERLADTLERLAAVGLDDFYRGDVGREIAADLRRIGSPVTRGDFDRYRAYFAEPLSATIPAGDMSTF